MTTHPPRAPRLTIIALSVLQLCCTAAAMAAEPAAEAAETPGEVVVISGQRVSLRLALAAQQKADNIVSVVSSDDIGGLPDKNAAEALARLPGVAVQRDQGEGRYIVVRGMGPDYNMVTINGATVPSPEAGRRAVALDVLPAGLIRSLEVSKTLTPDRDANSLGGTVDVKALSAFDLPGTHLSLRAGASHDGNTGHTSPDLGLLAARRFLDGTLGVAAGVSAERRRFGSDNVETGGAWNDGKLSGLELRDYLPQRERQALALNLDYRPQAGQSLYLRTLQSRFSDDEVRDRLTVSDISDADEEEEAAPDTPFSARVERRLRQRKYTQKITSVTTGGQTRFDGWTIAASAGASRATDKTPESISDARFRGLADVEGLRYSGTVIPLLTGPAAVSDAARYKVQGITLQTNDSRDQERHVKLDLTRVLAWGETRFDIKGGVKLSRRDKTTDTEEWGYTSSRVGNANYWGAGSTSMSDFVQGPLDYPFGALGLGIDPAAIRARVAGLDRSAARLQVESSLDDFNLAEDIDAAYLQTTIDLGAWRWLAGVRHERTSFDARGNQVSEDAVSPITRARKYDHWLPNLQLRYDIDRQTSVRAAWTGAVVRANFSQLAPGISFDSDTEAVIGNPDLKPLTARNLDLGIERMLGQDGSLSAYVYTKDIRHFAYTTDLAGTGAWQDFESAISYANGDKARVSGIELAYSQSLRMLPAPFNGLLVGANLSLNRSRATIGRHDIDSGSYQTRRIRLPGQSNRTANLILGYESGPISTRLAVNHKSPYLLEVGGDLLDAAGDAWVDSQRQVDFSFGYQLKKGLQVVFEGINLNDESYYVYQGSRAYNMQYERYGRTYKLSLKATLF